MSEARVFRPSRRTLVLDGAAAAFLVVGATSYTALNAEAGPGPRVVAAVFGVLVAAFFAMTVSRRVTLTSTHLEVRRLGTCRRFDLSRVEVTVHGGRHKYLTVTGDGRSRAFALTSFGFDDVLALRRAMSSGSPGRPTSGNDPTRRNA